MTTIPKLSRTLNEVLTERADALARVSGFVRRSSKLSGAAFVQTLVFGWLGTPTAGIGALSRLAGALGVPITPQGLEQRFTKEAATYLQQVLAVGVKCLVESDPSTLPILRRFSGVYVQDSTTVALPDDLAAAWPACDTSKEPEDAAASLKLQVRLELTRGTIAGPEPHAGRASDRATVTLDTPVPAGALFIADLGYFSLPHLRTLGEDGVFWLSRLQVQTAVFTTDGQRFDLLAWLRGHATTPAVAIDQPVLLGVGQRLPARLLAVLVPPEVSATHLATTIRRLAAGLTAGATIDTRRRSPGTWQFLLALDSHIDDSQSSAWVA